ncbi:ABC1 kinase family protein [Aliikangiella sp. IMCC44359]|uniref:ABC1 kinase family protein n=1 Tax=Aliikangiella sp. IMCC44359 TaxID=3459125 RepID=UPI00403B3479
MNEKISTTDSIPTSKIKRTTITSMTAAKLGMQYVGYKAKTLLKDEQEKQQIKLEHEENIGNIIFAVLSQLRGTALKVSQLLSMEADILPISVRKKLKEACYEVPPINKALVRKQVVQELGKPPSDVFKGFNSQAFAAASIGQVHRGITFNDELVAVKIQYPGIASTIESDLKIIEKLFWTLSKTTELLPHKKVLKLMMKEMQERLREEVDYQVEADNIQWFKNQVQLPNVIIPEVFLEYSGKRVITFEMLDGLHLAEWLKTKPKQAEKNHFGQLLFDFFWYSVFKLKRINADPHPGNFLFLPNGKLGILDFGCVRALDDAFTQQCAQLIPALVKVSYENGSSEQLREVYQSLKIISAEIDQAMFESEILPYTKRFADWFAEAYVSDTFDFSNKQPCPGKPDDGSKKAISFLNGMYEEQLCFDRAHLGLMNLLTEIGAVVKTDWKKFI